MDKKLIGRCGLYCGECEIRTADESADEKYVAELAKKLDVVPEKIRCEGCLSLTEECRGYGCEIIACLESRDLKHCVQCAEIDDCTKFATMNTRHGGSVRINVRQIRSWGFERWLQYKEGGRPEEDTEEGGGEKRHTGGRL